MMPNMDPRQMEMMMKRMGIQQREIDGVQEIVIRTATKEYRFARAAVSVMTAQGTETWQIQGKPTVRDVGSSSAPTQAAPSAPPPSVPASASAPVGVGSGSASRYVPSADDVATVAQAAGCSSDKARAALEATGGDLAQAIVDLQG